MTFDGNNAVRYADHAGFQKSINWRSCHIDLNQFSALVRRILDKPEMTLSNDLQRLGLLLEYLSLAIESNERSVPAEERENEYSADLYVDYAMSFIRMNYSNVKIGDLARFIGINRSYLTNIFKQKTGVSPQEFLMRCKMERARGLLLETNVPVQDISKAVGYDNPLTFSKMFKNFYGLSPKHFRIRNQNEREEDK